MKKTILLLAVFALGTTVSMAQKIKHEKGTLAEIKGQKVLNIEFHYNDMVVGKDLTEEEYIAKKTEEYNKKEPGSGDKWAESWVRDREKRFEPKFIELFNNYAEKAKMKVDRDETAEYTLIVKTYYTEPGFNVGVVRKSASINVQYVIVKTGTDEVVAEYKQERIPGAQAMGYDFDTGSRIAEAYAKAGKSLGKMFAKKLK